VDADAHWLEPVTVFTDFLRDVGGPAAVEKFTAFYDSADSAWYRSTATERQARRLKRRAWWSDPWVARDRATAMLPKLMHERLPELGIDFAVVFPTLGLTSIAYPDPDLRVAACQALNLMTAEVFAGLGDRLAPVAAIPIVTPSEAVAELRRAVDLGFKVILFSGTMIRTPRDETGRPGHPYVDTFGLDAAHDYDPFWGACAELGVAVNDHGGAQTWPDRQSPTNFVHNHVGHFAEALHASCRAIVLGGVTRRFPQVPFAFLEGGVGWAAMLQLGLIEHFEKRALAPLRRYLDPANFDGDEFASLWERYAGGLMRGKADPASPVTPFVAVDELAAREVDDVDDFAASAIWIEDDIRRIFREQFFFGAEADDKLTSLAFRSELGLALRPMFSSDIGHYDVLDMSQVVAESFELVERGLIDEEQYVEFTFSNVVDLHTRLNPSFFEGTVVEQTVAERLSASGRR
jgi:predicted TIM-barrel fold metal-dependent hydrolase